MLDLYKDIMAYLLILLYLMCSVGLPAALYAMDLGTPRMTAPMQHEKFFETQRLAVQVATKDNPLLLEPQLAVSHDAREDAVGLGMKQTTHRVHGEAGGKLYLLGDITLTAVAKIPVYSYGVTSSANIANGASNSELLKNTGRLFWRSELGIPLGEGVGLNLFYDRSVVSRVDRPGVDEREEKYGTKLIFRFK